MTCGTNGGYHKHLKAGEPTCVPCRKAHNAAAMALRRARGIPPRVRLTDAERAERNRAHVIPYARALGRLRDAHRAEFARLYRQERGA